MFVYDIIEEKGERIMPIEGEISMLPIVLQSIMVVLMLIFLYVSMQQKMNDIFKWLVFAGIEALIQNVGYLTILLSKEVPAAKSALIVEYCGVSYVTSFAMFFVIRFFEKKIPNWLKKMVILENTMVLLSVIFMDYTDIFYKELYVNVVNGTVKVTSLKGPLFQIHLGVNIFEILICMVIPILYLKNAQTKVQKMKGWLTVVAIAFPWAAYLSLVLGVAKGFDPVPSSLVFATCVFFVANLKTGIFDGQNAAYYGIVENLKDPVMILRVTEEEETKKYASNIHDASASLLSLVNNILDLSKIEAGKVEIVEDDYELGKMLKQSYDLVSQKAFDKDLHFEVEVEDTLPKKLLGDEFHLNQVIVNILTNAIKYTPTGSVTLSVTGTKQLGGEWEMLCIKITDTGIGIKKENIDRLFDAFQRVDIKKNIHIEGTGLGLAISKRLIELLGGTIRVESVYGEGSTFVIELPQKIVDDSPLGNFMEQYVHNREIHKVHRTKFTAEKAKILVVDDIDMNLLVVKGLLKGTKVQIDTAKSGFESLERTKENKYDLIFMDHMMPGMDGIEAFQQIRQQENGKNKRTPVIILTANALSGMKEEYMEQGFDDYLSKPVNGEALEEALYRHISRELIIEE